MTLQQNKCTFLLGCGDAHLISESLRPALPQRAQREREKNAPSMLAAKAPKQLKSEREGSRVALGLNTAGQCPSAKGWFLGDLRWMTGLSRCMEAGDCPRIKSHLQAWGRELQTDPPHRSSFGRPGPLCELASGKCEWQGVGREGATRGARTEGGC